MAIRKELLLEGLDCANCANKIQGKVQELKGVETASVDFVSRRLMIQVKDGTDAQHVVKQAKATIHKLEPHIRATEENKHSHNKHAHEHNANNTRKTLIRLGLGAAIALVAGLAKLPLPLELSLFLLSYVIVGGDVVFRALRNITRGQVFDENFLMTIATVGAFCIKQFPEAVGVMLFYQVGEYLQGIAVNRSRKSISALMDIRPDYANVKIGNEIKTVSPEEVRVGDSILVKPGEKIPLDGEVIEGNSMLDTSALTGESVPKQAGPGSEVLSGCINKNGVLTIKVTKAYSESTVSKILDLVQNASSRKASTENFITKFARYYTPVVVLGALLLAIVPPLLISGESFADWIYRALVFLVISCPCALVISIPLGFFGGIGAASKKGILVKGSNYLEALNDVKYVVFDKTGTITKGVFHVTDIQTRGERTKEELLEYAAVAESYSNHPIAQSILQAYGRDIHKDNVEEYEEISGHGIKVKIQGRTVLAGNAKLMEKSHVEFFVPDTFGTVVHIAIDGTYEGYIVISDEPKEDAKHAIQQLKKLGIKKTIMLTGDVQRVAEKVGRQLEFDEVYAELLPQDKVEKLEGLDARKGTKEKLIFVGDGINDTPVLARADVGVAMGGVGSDAAIEAADIVIMTDEPSKIATAITIAKHTRKIVWQNIIFALAVKGFFLLLGALGIATMWEAVFSDVGVTILAVLNSMRVTKVNDIE